MADVQALLQSADRLVRDGRFAEAISAYLLVADHFCAAGLPLKQIAILKQVVKLIDEAAPGLVDVRLLASEQLAVVYRDLGLTADTARLRPRPPPSN